MYNSSIQDLSGSLLHSSTGDLLSVVADLASVVPSMATYKKVWYEMQRVDGAYASYYFAPGLSPHPVLVQIIWTELKPTL